MGSMQRYAATVLGAGAVVLAFGAFAPAAAQAATPATLYVSQGGLNSGTCPATAPCATVSYALTQAASGATIEVSGTIDDNLNITSPVTITTWPGGPDGSSAVLDYPASNAAVVYDQGVTGITLHDLTIENGDPGILNYGGTVTLSDSTVTGALGDAGIDTDGIMTITDSTIANNSLGGIKNNQGTTTVIASTISGNSGYGVESINGGVVSLGATIVAGNTSANCQGAAGSLVSAGYNLTNDQNGTACAFNAPSDLVNKNPLLGHLVSNGGLTQTMLPSTKSPAANVIPKGTLPLRGVAVCPATDQRGVARPGRGHTRCSIGAAEVSFKNPTTTSVTVSPATVTAGTNVIYLAVVTPQSGTGTPAGTITFTTGSTTLCTAVLSGGVAACGATTAPVGTDTVTGTYSGGSGYASSSATATLTVT